MLDLILSENYTGEDRKAFYAVFENIRSLEITRDSIKFVYLREQITIYAGNGGYIYRDKVYHTFKQI